MFEHRLAIIQRTHRIGEDDYVEGPLYLGERLRVLDVSDMKPELQVCSARALSRPLAEVDADTSRRAQHGQ